MSENLCKEETFKNVFFDQSERLRNFLYYKTGNMAQAEDLVQDAFGKLWENCSKVAIEKVKSFLFTIANNLFINQVKHKQVVLKFEQRTKTQVDREDPAFLLEKEEFRKRLQKAISDLPEKQREVFMLRYFEEMKYQEMSELLQTSESALKSNYHHASKKVEDFLKNN